LKSYWLYTIFTPSVKIIIIIGFQRRVDESGLSGSFLSSKKLAKILTLTKKLTYFFNLLFPRSKAIFYDYNQKRRFRKMSVWFCCEKSTILVP